MCAGCSSARLVIPAVSMPSVLQLPACPLHSRCEQAGQQTDSSRLITDMAAARGCSHGSSQSQAVDCTRWAAWALLAAAQADSGLLSEFERCRHLCAAQQALTLRQDPQPRIVGGEEFVRERLVSAGTPLGVERQQPVQQVQRHLSCRPLHVSEEALALWPACLQGAQLEAACAAWPCCCVWSRPAASLPVCAKRCEMAPSSGNCPTPWHKAGEMRTPAAQHVCSASPKQWLVGSWLACAALAAARGVAWPSRKPSNGARQESALIRQEMSPGGSVPDTQAVATQAVEPCLCGQSAGKRVGAFPGSFRR